MADEKIIFSMVGVSKTFTNQKKVLNGIYLSFFYGAKIGIIGLNGSGKSTLMKIIARAGQEFPGRSGLLSRAIRSATSNRNRSWTIRKPSAKWSRKGAPTWSRC